MDVTPLIPAGRQVINAYGDGGFTISGTRWQGSVLVFPTRTLAWEPTSLAELDEESLRPVMEAEDRPELLLLGCGPAMAPVPAALRMALRSVGIKLEIMDTGAACRTYTILLPEDRSVAAALIAV